MDWALYQTHARDIESAIGYVCRRSRLDCDVDDFAQDARLFVANRSAIIFSGFKGDSSLTTYLSRIVWHYYLRWQRERSREQNRLRVIKEPLLLATGSGSQRADSLPSTDVGWRFKAQIEAWNAALSEEERDLIRQRFSRGRQMSHIARDTGTTAGAAFKRTYRLIADLRRRLVASGVTQGDRRDIEEWLRRRGADLLQD